MREGFATCDVWARRVAPPQSLSRAADIAVQWQSLGDGSQVRRGRRGVVAVMPVMVMDDGVCVE